MKRLITVAILLGMAQAAFAAAGAATVWEVQSNATAGNVNGGGFDPGATFTVTDLATNTNTANTASPIVSSASYNFVVADRNHWIYVSAGTHWATGCWFKITDTASNKATLDATTGHGICRDTTKGFPTPKFAPTTTAGVTNDATATLTGGTFGVDRSQTTASFANAGDLASTVGTTNPCVVTSVTYPFVATDIGNTLVVASGTSWTAGWYEIVSVSAGAATLDRACGTSASLSNAVWAMGGAISFGSSTTGHTDNLFLSGAHLAAGNRIFIKSGSYTMQAATTTTVSGTSIAPLVLEGYNSTRGDAPTGSTRPLLDMTTVTYVAGSNVILANLALTGSATVVLTVGASNILWWVKGTNTSTIGGRTALSLNTSNVSQGYFVEAISYRGKAFATVGGSASIYCYTCYFHDSDVGLSDNSTSGSIALHNSIIADNITAAYAVTAAHTGPLIFTNNTFYGAKNKLGTAITVATGGVNPRLVNNIFYGFATVVTSADAQTGGMTLGNDYFNNTATGSGANWQQGLNALVVDPGFVGVDQYTGSAATSLTNVLTDSGANFASVVNNQDFLLISSGTGTGLLTNTKLLITDHNATSLTVSSNITTSGTGSGLSYQVTYGHNFAIGTNLKAAGAPGAFPAGLTTGYVDIGAVQRQEAGGSSGGQSVHTYVQ